LQLEHPADAAGGGDHLRRDARVQYAGSVGTGTRAAAIAALGALMGCSDGTPAEAPATAAAAATSRPSAAAEHAVFAMG
jgi:hypothetical protein